MVAGRVAGGLDGDRLTGGIRMAVVRMPIDRFMDGVRLNSENANLNGTNMIWMVRGSGK